MFSNGLPEVDQAQLYRLTHRFRQQAGSYRPGFFWMGLHWNLCRRRRSALARECGFAHTSTSPDKTQFPWVLLMACAEASAAGVGARLPANAVLLTHLGRLIKRISL
jgi:hypothetical protein